MFSRLRQLTAATLERPSKFTIDWVLFGAILPLLGAGLVTMHSFLEDNRYFEKQLIWISVSLILFFIMSMIDFRLLRRTSVIVTLFAVSCSLLILVLLIGKTVKGAQS